MAKILIETGELPQFQKKEPVQQEAVGGSTEDNEYFLYEGPMELKTARFEITKDSLKRAALRIEHSKIKKITIDPLEEEDLIDNEVLQVNDFDLSMCQYGDSSALSRGAFSHDSKYYATAGSTGQCKIWSVPDCGEVTHLNGHLIKVNDVVFNPTMERLSPNSPGCLATASSDTTVRLWTFDKENKYQESVCLKGHEDRVNRLVFHNLGKHLISTSHDKTWRFWDIETRRELLVQTGHAKPVYATSLHPDGSLLVSLYIKYLN
jgi:U4/U6 small nuclear ribonucleoprotein PRP4